jgi:hypothetical protein
MLFAAVHESAIGTSATSQGDPDMSAYEGQSSRVAEVVGWPSLTRCDPATIENNSVRNKDLPAALWQTDRCEGLQCPT